MTHGVQGGAPLQNAALASTSSTCVEPGRVERSPEPLRQRQSNANPLRARAMTAPSGAPATNRAAKFVPTLDPVIEDDEPPQAKPQASSLAQRRHPLPLRPRLPHATSASKPPMYAPDVFAQAINSANANALGQVDLQQQLQAIARAQELHKAVVELSEKGASTLSAGI